MKYAAASVALLFAAPAIAQDAPRWKMDAGKSTLTFSVAYEKDKIEGAFPGFSAEITFAPDALEKSRIEVSIPVADFTSDDYDAKEYLPEEAWLDTEHYKAAKFVSEEITRTGENAYLAKGTLTLKKIAKPLELPFTLTFSNDEKQAVAEGKTTLSRAIYGIGKGEEETAAMLGDAVTVRFYIEARRAK